MTATRSPLEVTVLGSTLVAVPAVHFRSAFAEAVNRICCDPQRRPDAIGVELGPITAAAVSLWLTELGIGPERRKRLPVMLGLVKPNRYLKPSVRERARALQYQAGVALQDLPPEVLQRELGYSPFSTLVLSPTDSIIEALRCGCELGIPVYGVDLDDMAEPQTALSLIQDPSAAHDRVADYVGANQAFAQGCDEEIDPRRERVMAARLKALLGRHGRVLFTGGLAHWQRIHELLTDPSLRPAMIAAEPTAEAFAKFERTTVDPRIAVRYLDRFPAVADRYQRWRPHPRLGAIKSRPRSFDPASLHRTLLRKAYRRYFPTGDPAVWTSEQRRDWAAAPAFEQLIGSQTCLSLRSLPTFGDILASARCTMSRAFCAVLAATLMAYPWIKPGGQGTEADLEPSGRDAPGDTVRIRRDGRKDSQPFSLKTLPGQSASEIQPSPAPSDLPAAKGRSRQLQLAEVWSSSHHSWPPWDNLLNGLSWAAIHAAASRQRVSVAEAFSGQLLEGIAIKATLRAQARGVRTLFVRNQRLEPLSAISDPAEGLPVIWLFDADPATDGCAYENYFEHLSAMLPYARRPALFREKFGVQGDSVIGVIGFGKSNRDDPVVNREDLDVRCFELRGAVLFMPLFPGHQGFTRWFERIGFLHNPYSSLFGGLAWPQTVSQSLARCLGTGAPRLRWQDVLICAAIPYGGRSVTVVIPPGFEPAPMVDRFAAHYGKTVQRISLTRFAARHVRRLRVNYMMRGRYHRQSDSIVYQPGAEQALGESLHCYRELVPRHWRAI